MLSGLLISLARSFMRTATPCSSSLRILLLSSNSSVAYCWASVWMDTWFTCWEMFSIEVSCFIMSDLISVMELLWYSMFMSSGRYKRYTDWSMYWSTFLTFSILSAVWRYMVRVSSFRFRALLILTSIYSFFLLVSHLVTISWMLFSRMDISENFRANWSIVTRNSLDWFSFIRSAEDTNINLTFFMVSNNWFM